MEFFLPVAQVQINVIIILFLSFCVGLISGLFGIGGGFLMTPVLIFLGIPPAFAVANEANNILGTSVSGALTHWFRKTLDYKMGSMIVLGGLGGTMIGMFVFHQLSELGIINQIIALAYIYMLVIIGTLMFAKGASEIINVKTGSVVIMSALTLHRTVKNNHEDPRIALPITVRNFYHPNTGNSNLFNFKKLNLSFFSKIRRILGNPHYSPFRTLNQKRKDMFKKEDD